MIGKILKSSTGSSANRIRYVYRSKKHDHDLVGIKTIDTNCFSFFPEIGMRKGGAEDLGCMMRFFHWTSANRSQMSSGGLLYGTI